MSSYFQHLIFLSFTTLHFLESALLTLWHINFVKYFQRYVICSIEVSETYFFLDHLHWSCLVHQESNKIITVKLRPCPHKTKEIWKCRFISEVKPTGYTNLSWKQSFWKMLFISIGGIWKPRLWTQSFSKQCYINFFDQVLIKEKLKETAFSNFNLLVYCGQKKFDSVSESKCNFQISLG